MGRPRKKSLQFSTEDRNELQRIASSRTEPAARVSRARALLAYEDGEGTNGEIAFETGMSTVALANLVNKCISFGPMVALNDLPRSGRKSVITDEDKAYVKHIACYKPKDFGYPEELWSAEKLAKHIREHCTDDGSRASPALPFQRELSIHRRIRVQLYPDLLENPQKE